MTFLGLRLPVILLFVMGFPLFWLLWIGVYAISPGPDSAKKQIEVVIPQKTSLGRIQEILADNYIIKDDARFTMLAGIMGAAHQLMAGEYVMEAGLKPYEVIKLLKQGKVLYRSITIPEGTDTARVADILDKAGWIDRNSFLKLTEDQEFIKEMGVAAKSLEGYLFPDTYFLSKGQQDETAIIKMMVDNHQQVFAEIMQASSAKANVMTPHEIITLAAIVEKETGRPEERPLVASVFLNRLARGMRLQADPTVRYATGKLEGPLTRSDLKIPSPYNTYHANGLPPGPICNPGRAAIEAVLFPADTEYFYFVSKDDTTHYFSRTLEEHNRAVARFRDNK
jgi:UPF0755 protein